LLALGSGLAPVEEELHAHGDEQDGGEAQNRNFNSAAQK